MSKICVVYKECSQECFEKNTYSVLYWLGRADWTTPQAQGTEFPHTKLWLTNFLKDKKKTLFMFSFREYYLSWKGHSDTSHNSLITQRYTNSEKICIHPQLNALRKALRKAHPQALIRMIIILFWSHKTNLISTKIKARSDLIDNSPYTYRCMWWCFKLSMCT